MGKNIHMPLKRHFALQDLSRDHHLFLVEARNIRWLLDGDKRATTTQNLVENLLKFWQEHGNLHLLEEEEVTYPFYLQHAPLAKKDIDSLRTDHAWIRDKFEELTDMPRFENCSPLLKSLGEYIVSHVRHEERGIYEQIQNTLDESALQELAAKSQSFRISHRGEAAIGPAHSTLPDAASLNIDLDDQSAV
jgi:hemerythrin-like domain-containing protein